MRVAEWAALLVAGAHVSRARVDRVPSEIAAIAARHGARRLVIPRGFPTQWRTAELELSEDDGKLTAHELEQFDGRSENRGSTFSMPITVISTRGRVVHMRPFPSGLEHDDGAGLGDREVRAADPDQAPPVLGPCR